MKKRRWKLVLFPLILLIVLIGIYRISHWSQANNEPKITSDLVGNRIESAQELITTKYYYTNTASFENTKDFYGWKIPFTTKTFLVTYDGIINAGVDLKEVKVTVNDQKQTIDITLPKPKILSHELDEDSLKVFNEKDSIFNAIKVDDYTAFEKDQKKQAEQKAIDRGLLNEAEERTKTAITSLLNEDSTIHKDFTINIHH
ncbi:MAG: DUF4230 domain-containing protein [Aerococcus sp.]|nr:DUF4230 domain-containing protein [Aerococcus sp.]